MLLLITFAAFSCLPSKSSILEREKALLGEKQPQEWMNSDPDLWKPDNYGQKTDALIHLPKKKLKKEKIGKRKKVYSIFDRYELKEELSNGRHRVWADITAECKGHIEIDYVLNSEDWLKPNLIDNYYTSVNNLIERVANKLLIDHNDPFTGEEKQKFILALKTLAWQESSWQHYFRYKDWFFVILSKSTSNKLGDWGITQVARSGFKRKKLYNKAFFDLKGHCSISSTLYYGFLEYFYCYLNSREMSCNKDLDEKVIGAYNRYVSGFSSCHNRYSQMDKDYGNFQKRALNEFYLKFTAKPWEKRINVK